MTTPKPGSPKPGAPAAEDIELHSSIEELENLLADKEVTINTHPAIPVLDDEVDPDELYLEEEQEIPDVIESPLSAPNEPNLSETQLQELILNLEDKLTGELDALVNILKDAIKDSIITEIKSQLESKTTSSTPSKPGDKNPS